ncbi:MAG: DUF3649 domain-containing protein [Lachnospiraceae bacterium]|nr:DUF3649 domain-containing protein [Lachnospiraceae bacterium]
MPSLWNIWRAGNAGRRKWLLWSRRQGAPAGRGISIIFFSAFCTRNTARAWRGMTIFRLSP